MKIEYFIDVTESVENYMLKNKKGYEKKNIPCFEEKEVFLAGVSLGVMLGYCLDLKSIYNIHSVRDPAVNAYKLVVYFKNKDDAALFKLTWA